MTNRQLQVPFGVDNSGAIAYITEADAADRQNLITLVGTQPGERAMRPTYGVATRDLLFNNADPVLGQMLTTQIQDAATTYAPEVSVHSVRVSADTANQLDGRIAVEVAYAPAPGRLAPAIETVTTTVAVGG